MDLQKKLNIFLLTYGLECFYKNYNSKHSFRNIDPSSDNRKNIYIIKNTHDLFDFEENKLYYLNNITYKEFQSITAVNLMADRLLTFSISPDSDFAKKNYNYSNTITDSKLFNHCSVIHLQHIKEFPYEIIHYQGSTGDLIPIELYKNCISQFTIAVRNQSNE